MERQKLILGLQAVSAIGILVIGLLTYFGQSTTDLRREMREGFTSIRAEMNEEFASVRTEMREGFASIRTEMKDMNTRLSRVEGYLGLAKDFKNPIP